ncbi:MAG: serine hydrolase [Marinirhabdus sp.]
MKFFSLIFLFLATACTRPEISPLEHVLMSAHPAMARVLHDPAAYEIQVLYTRISKDKNGRPVFTGHSFRNNSSVYFYPASTVKLPLAVLAMEFCSQHKNITPHTPYTLTGDTTPHTIADDVRQIFAVSDNRAYNRLYELLGRDRTNKLLREKGAAPIRIAHRLSTPNAADSTRATFFFKLKDTVIPVVGKDGATIAKLPLKNQQKGKGFIRDGKLVHAPMDFSEKNHFPLKAQQGTLKRLFYPEAFLGTETFGISEKNRKLLLHAMHAPPRKQGYNSKEHYDSYGKFFMYGDTKEDIPQHIKIYNKVGYAYGTLTDNAYIVDEKNGIRFFLSATVLVNKNGIFNDDTYEYETIGIPFLSQLGRELYLYEYAQRQRE